MTRRPRLDERASGIARRGRSLISDSAPAGGGDKGKANRTMRRREAMGCALK